MPKYRQPALDASMALNLRFFSVLDNISMNVEVRILYCFDIIGLYIGTCNLNIDTEYDQICSHTYLIYRVFSLTLSV